MERSCGHVPLPIGRETDRSDQLSSSLRCPFCERYVAQAPTHCQVFPPPGRRAAHLRTEEVVDQRALDVSTCVYSWLSSPPGGYPDVSFVHFPHWVHWTVLGSVAMYLLRALVLFCPSRSAQRTRSVEHALVRYDSNERVTRFFVAPCLRNAGSSTVRTSLVLVNLKGDLPQPCMYLTV